MSLNRVTKVEIVMLRNDFNNDWRCSWQEWVVKDKSSNQKQYYQHSTSKYYQPHLINLKPHGLVTKFIHVNIDIIEW